MPSSNQLPKSLLHPRYWPSWWAVGGLSLLAFLPWQTRRWLGKQLGSAIYKHNKKRRQVILINLQLAFPELSNEAREQFTQQNLQEYAAALLDYSVLFFRSRTALYKRIQLSGQEHLEKAIAQNQNVMLLLGHSVWLEFAPVAIGEHLKAYGSYKPFKNPVFNWLIMRSRLRDVQFVVSREEGMIKLVRSLEPSNLLFFLPDQDHGEKNSVFVPFFATEKSTLTTPARIAKLGRACAFPIMAFFDAETGIYQVKVEPALEDFGALDSQEDAANMNASFEKLINQYPTQYMWLLKIFKTRPTKGENPYLNN
ncbi:MAG TPA: lysophospholipid acyltransferase family protein [Thiolinea sp.]|nr:lysophospholipid acyltransferase family protein [Thiolinea sp.]